MQAVKMYTTAVCPYCVRAKQILKAKGVDHIEEIRVDTAPDQREHMMQRSLSRVILALSSTCSLRRASIFAALMVFSA